MEAKFTEELGKTEIVMEACTKLKVELFTLQRERLAVLKEKAKPIVVHGMPCMKTNYKLQIKYLQVRD